MRVLALEVFLGSVLPVLPCSKAQLQTSLGLMSPGFTKETPSRLQHQSNKMPRVQPSVPPSERTFCAGILTCYPSPPPFGIGLGPTNPSLIIIAKETLVFRRTGVSPVLRLLVPAFSLLCAPPVVHTPASVRQRTLSYHAQALTRPAPSSAAGGSEETP